MRTFLTSTLTAILLTGVAAAPLATVFTVASVDAAYAKSDKSKGNGSASKGNSGNKGKSAGKSGNKGKGNSGGGSKGKSAKNGKDPIGNFFNKLRGKDKKAQRTASAPAAKAGNSGKPAKGSGLHPSELGNMNGALNANINAVLAHVKNGNTNGPVGAMAALAVARSGADGAAETLATPEGKEYSDLLIAVENNEDYDTVEDYLAAKEAGGDDFVIDEDIEASIANLGTSDLEEAVANNDEYASASEYLLAKELAAENEEEFVTDPDLEDAIAGLGQIDGDTLTDVQEADTALEAVSDAEGDLVATWNKNTGDPDAEAELIERANARLDGFEDEIAAAVDASATHGDDDDMEDDVAEELDDEDEIEDEEVVLILE